ncbi:MAG: carboxypeptidase regulatory-like domain-containing protein [Chitinispirillaceae bacterium]|nr:carboxypeptidase regulatory-like domain-containing protein [Chitinispirillaceae bacterium]
MIGGGAARLKPVLIGGILFLLPTGFLSCSLSPSAGGATDTETGGVIAGVVLDSSGNKASGVSVTLIPAAYNPVQDKPLPDSHTVITDEKGRYAFTVNEPHDVNIYARRAADRTCFLHTGIIPDRNGTVRDTGRLARTGYLMVILPDTVDTNDGYLYFTGTPLCNEVKKGSPFGGGYCGVIFDALPSSMMPPLIYARRGSDDAGAVIAPALKIVESDSMALETGEAFIKPLWRFSFIVGVKDTINRYFGTIAGIAPMIANQFRAATDAFNAAECFNGVFLFAADSFYEYSGTIDDEGPAPSGFHYRLLYDDITPSVIRNEVVRFSYIYLSAQQPDTLFGNRYTGYLIKLFGELRGALNLSWVMVDSLKNAVNNAAFPEIPSIMSSPLKSREWDDYSASIINYNAGGVGSERNMLAAAFTDTMGIVAKTTDGNPVPGAEIQIYGSVLNTRTVNNSQVLAGLTDEEGRYVFPRNPFIADSTGRLVYGNLLIIATVSGDTASTWFPVCEAGSAYFTNPDAPLYKEVGF